MEEEKSMKTWIENHLIKNGRWLTFAAILFFIGAVFRITADKWLEGIIYFAAAVCLTSIQRLCCKKEDDTDDNGRTDEV